MRIPKQLEPLHDMGLIESVLRPLMSGKEAAAWVVRSEGEVRCAKVYKEAQSRSFKQRAAYTEGRRMRNSRQARAIAKGSKFGKQQEELAWQTAEVEALYKLSAAGVRVPEPVIFAEGVLLMELVLDHNGDPAPRLFDVPLQATHARAMLEFLAQQCARMLLAGVVHGDLSEYNVLLAWDGPVIIDLPQAIDASANRNARDVFVRDLDHLTQYLARFSPDLLETEYGREIWNLYETGRLKADSVLTGKGPRRSKRQIDGRRLAREVEEAAEAERPRDDDGGGRRKRRRKRRGSQGGGAVLPEQVSARGGSGGEPRRQPPREDERSDEPRRRPPREDAAPAAPAGAEAAPRRRRRRRRRGGGGGGGSRGGSSD